MPDKSRRHALDFVGVYSGRDRQERSEFEDLITGLETQFLSQVLVAPDESFPSYRANNYMDGHNGPYRWLSSASLPGSGYQSFELSGALHMGWWTFLDSDQIVLLKDSGNLFQFCVVSGSVGQDPDVPGSQMEII